MFYEILENNFNILIWFICRRNDDDETWLCESYYKCNLIMWMLVWIVKLLSDILWRGPVILERNDNTASTVPVALSCHVIQQHLLLVLSVMSKHQWKEMYWVLSTMGWWTESSMEQQCAIRFCVYFRKTAIETFCMMQESYGEGSMIMW